MIPFLTQRFLATMVAAIVVTAACGNQPNYDDPNAYTRILSFDGRLNPHDGPVHVDVYAMHDVGTGTFNSHAFLQTMIRVVSPAGDRRFRLPVSWAAESCQIVDLDGDGLSEVVLLQGGTAMIVSFRDGAFVFRPLEDQIVKADNVRLADTDGDGLLEFVLPPELDSPPRQRSLISRWTFKSGFSRPK